MVRVLLIGNHNLTDCELLITTLDFESGSRVFTQLVNQIDNL